MKKIVIMLSIVMVCVMVFSITFNANNLPTEKIILNENQKNILRSFGCSKEEIENLTRAQVSKIISTGIITNPEYIEIILPSEPINKRDEETNKLLREKGYTEDFIQFIINQGYLYKEILDIDDYIMKMMIAEYEKVAPGKYAFTNESLASQSSYNLRDIYNSPISEEASFNQFQLWPDPPNYPNTYNIGVQGLFHPWVSIRQQALYFSNQCLSGATDLFNTSSNLYYDYNILGEDKGTTGCHEGVDLQYTGNGREHEVYSVTPGLYNGTNTSWGAVCIYDSNLLATSVYMHLKNIQYANLGTEGLSTITKETYIGDQGKKGLDESAGNHVHFEVHPNENYGSVTSGTWVAWNGDLILVSAFPYVYLNWY